MTSGLTGDVAGGVATGVSAVPDDERLARVALSRVVEPGSHVVREALRTWSAREAWDRLRSGHGLPGHTAGTLGGIQGRVQGHDPTRDLERALDGGGRVLCPGYDEWPQGLDWSPDTMAAATVADLAAPWAPFVRGPHHLGAAVTCSVSLVGARAATAYGTHVAGELGHGLDEAGLAVVSGGVLRHRRRCTPRGPGGAGRADRRRSRLRAGRRPPAGPRPAAGPGRRRGSARQRAPARLGTDPGALPRAQPVDRGPVAGDRGGRGCAAQRLAVVGGPGRRRAAPARDGGSGARHLGPVRWLPPAAAVWGRHVRDQRRRGPGAARRARRAPGPVCCAARSTRVTSCPTRSAGSWTRYLCGRRSGLPASRGQRASRHWSSSRCCRPCSSRAWSISATVAGG